MHRYIVGLIFTKIHRYRHGWVDTRVGGWIYTTMYDEKSENSSTGMDG